MKNKIILLLLSVVTLTKADEGMWMPQLIAALNFADMQRNGLKLTAEQIYSINKSSMKDAVILFGGGCTAEVISDKGLILTNHHCGFSSIAALSTLQNDYLKNGFWAMKAEEEIFCKDLSVTFIKKIEDVTSRVLAHVKAGFTERQRDSAIHAATAAMEKSAKEAGQEVTVRPFYYGNEFYMFTVEVFRDIRLVGAPPESIGKFGGETDNWMWPRHNADFSMFRIYASKDNKPAVHSNDNVPYKPAYSFPISLKGVQKGDFTLVYGFPGRTQEYLSSYAVDFVMNTQDPLRVELRGKRLEIIEADMKKNDTLRLMYTGRHASVANYFKKWNGEMQGLKRSNALEKKQDYERKLVNSLLNDEKKLMLLSDIYRELKMVYKEYVPVAVQADYYNECLLGIDAVRMLTPVVNAMRELRKKKTGKENHFDAKLKEATPAIPFANLNKETDRKLCAVMLTYYAEHVEKDKRVPYIDSLLKIFGGDAVKLSDHLYDNTILVDNKKARDVYANFEARAGEITADPLFRLTEEVDIYFHTNVLPNAAFMESRIAVLQRQYMQLQRETVKDRKFYPDANGTMRVTYGKVADYKPRDGVEYGFFTTLDGLVEKNKSGKDDYFVMPRLLELYEKRDFGQYADKTGKLRVAFIGSNHTTGGNSGSPVINARGELIGTNFDREWEGTMSDIMYNPAICRNITLDVRFTLWIVDKYAGAGYLLNEMKLVR